MSKTKSVKSLRKQLFVDPNVQGALVVRAVLYWLECMLSIALMLLCWRIMTDPDRLLNDHLSSIWFDYWPACFVSFMLLPVVVVDMMRLSNRFCGPMLRLRRYMRQLARGEYVEPIEFRGGDFWCNLAQEFNAVAMRVQGQTCVPRPDQEAEAEAEARELSAAVEVQ